MGVFDVSVRPFNWWTIGVEYVRLLTAAFVVVLLLVVIGVKVVKISAQKVDAKAQTVTDAQKQAKKLAHAF